MEQAETYAPPVVYTNVYTLPDRGGFLMQKAKLFQNGGSQAIRLPKDCRFEGDEVCIKKIGNKVMIYDLDQAWEDFIDGPKWSDEFANDFLEYRAMEHDREVGASRKLEKRRGDRDLFGSRKGVKKDAS
jgi:antitoxin VapB